MKKVFFFFVLILSIIGYFYFKSSKKTIFEKETKETHTDSQSQIPPIYDIERRLPLPKEEITHISKSPSKTSEELTIDTGNFPNIPLGKELKEHLNLAMTSGLNAEENYQKSLEGLKKQSEKAIPLLHDAYKHLGSSSDTQRWYMVETIRAIGTENAFQPLKEIASSSIPEEKKNAPVVHSYDPQMEERIIRATALEGIGEITKESYSKEKEDFLYEQALSQEETTIKQRAIRGFLNLATTNNDYDRRVKELKSKLDAKYHDLIHLRSISADELLQKANASQEIAEKELETMEEQGYEDSNE